MNEKEVELLKQVLETAGSVGTQGFEAMVAYTWAAGLAWLLGGVALLLLGLVGIVVPFVKDDKWDDDALGASFVGGGFACFLAILFIVSNIPDVIEPEGATVREIISKATG